MSPNERDPAVAAALDAALDGVLTRVLPPPQLPAGFRAGVLAAIARDAQSEALNPALRARLEREQRERLREFEAGYLRLRRRTLGTLIGGAFAAGALVALALPWLRATFGPSAPLVLASAGAAIGLAIGISTWLGRSGLPRPLQRF
jgi:hypothetical protein